MKEVPAKYLTDHQVIILSAAKSGPVLDLACGSGLNGLFLAEKGIEVHFWDKDKDALYKIDSLSRVKGLRVFTRFVDLEAGQGDLLPVEFFGAAMVFRYLHRPLMPEIKRAVLPGGIIIYETFTTRQAEIGKPRNPDFLLRENELSGWFEDWDIIDQYQGKLENPMRFMAGVVARKPGLRT